VNLHEYQSKALFRDYGLSVPQGEIADTPEKAIEAAKKIGGSRWIVKAQVHAGGRGKAGGVKLCENLEEVAQTAKALLGKNLVTYQTNQDGQLVNVVLVEQPSSIADELYFGAVVDRASQRIVLMCSTEGGVEIEKVASETPEKIHQIALQPMLGAMPYQARQLAFSLNLQGKQIQQFVHLVNAICRLFIDKDLALIEINPLIITDEGDLFCLDAKINVDSNAEYRQSALWEMRDTSQEDKRELEAAKHQLNYVALDGNIGCMVNGAGLAMATMDTIQLYGGTPANFLDVGGGATAERVTEAFKLILSDEKVKAILINIFGGIVRCDLIAEGIIQAAKQVELNIPVVVRLEGNHHQQGKQLLQQSGLNLVTADDLADAAQKILKIG
jgi:succinyl-CoA synthetase beta subunit